MTGRRTTLFIKIFLVFTGMIFIIVTGISIQDYLKEQKALTKGFQKDQLRAESNVENIIRLTDQAYKVMEASLDSRLEANFSSFIKAYNDAKGNIDSIDLKALKTSMGDDIELYIIDDQGIIQVATVPEDVGLDFQKIAPPFYEYLERIRKSDHYFADRITTSSLEGMLRKYAYHPSPDNRYILELSLESDAFTESLAALDIEKVLKETVKLNKELLSISTVNDGFFMMETTREDVKQGEGKLPKIEETYQKQVIDLYNQRSDQRVSIKEEGNLERVYHFIDLKDDKFATDNSRVVEYIYDWSFLNREVQDMGTDAIIRLMAALIISMLIALFISRNITKPIKKTAQILGAIAEGEGNLTSRLDIDRRDEVGLLADNFNTFVAGLESTIISVKTTGKEVEEAKATIGSTAEETTAGIREIDATIKAVGTNVAGLSESFQGVNSSIREINSSVQTQNKEIEEQSSAVEESVAAVEEMVSSLANVASVIRQKKEATDRLVKNARSGGEKMAETGAAVEEIAGNIDTISEMVDIINNIASQTNLLSMNAAIEAAHAGDAGKGFAVVADEIRKLAETSGENAKEISRVLTGILENINHASDSSKQTSAAFESINGEVSKVSSAFDEILSSAAELSSGGEQIRRSMHLLEDITVTVRENAGNISGNSASISSAMEPLADLSMQVSASLEEATVGTGQITAAMENLTVLTEKLDRLVDNLMEKTGRFVTGEDVNKESQAG
jgi:methyl-accepting chemotaxis protein